MANDNSLALVGAGVFAHNIYKVLTSGGCPVEYFVDEIKAGQYMGCPVFRARDLPAETIVSTAKFVVAISHPDYRQAAVDRLLQQGIDREKIVPLTDDHLIPILGLVFSKFGDEAVAFFLSDQCRSIFDLEQYFFGRDWRLGVSDLDPKKPTLAFCFYGRGGGFRRHLRGLIPRLSGRFNLLAIMDEELPGEGFDIPELIMGPDTACRLQEIGLPGVDLSLTAHFIPCCPENAPKVNFLHTSFDFILEPNWLVDRLESADPHYIFASTRATFDWLKELVGLRPLKNRVCLIPGGYTRLDENLRHAQKFDGAVDSLIYAPTLSLNAVEHHELTYSAPYGAAILKKLLESFPDQRVIFRPHPNDLQLLRDGRDDNLARPFLDALQVCEENPRCHLDDQKTFYMDSYNRSRIMVSDTSSTAYTFALTTCRPVVFFSPHDDQVRDLFSSGSAFIRHRKRVGQVVGSVDEMASAMTEMNHNLDTWQERVAAYRQEMCFNPGRTEEYFVENIEFILENRKYSDRLYLNWDDSANSAAPSAQPKV